MKLFSFLFICLLFLSEYSEAQKYCHYRAKKFNQPVSKFQSDYFNLKPGSSVIGNKNFQFEPAVLLLNIAGNNSDKAIQLASTALFRFGILNRAELRLGISTLNSNSIEGIELTENERIYPVSLGFKAVLLYTKMKRPVISVLPEVLVGYNQLEYKIGIIADLNYYNMIEFTCYNGIQSGSITGNIYIYSYGMVLNADNSKIGIYAFATNRFPYFDDILNFGLTIKFKKIQFNAGYGVHEDNGMVLAGLSIRTGKYFE